MSVPDRLPEKQKKVYTVLFLLGLGILCLIAVYLVVPRIGRESPLTHDATASDSSDDALASAREGLYTRSDINICRNALQQINLHLARHPEDRPQSLTEKERNRLVQWFDLDDDELAEVASTSFTHLDAHHLDLCFLMRDAARALDVSGLPPEVQAQAAFDWVVRQVRLEERPGEFAPPQFVLRRGWGTALERSVVFLALLQQVGIDGCMIACPREIEGRAVLQPWVPGALVNGQILLFDTRLGMPLPGRNGRGIATLARVRTEGDLLSQLTRDQKYPYDVTSQQLKGAEIRLMCFLSALAPRMRYLENILGPQNKVHLSEHPAAVLERFQKATKNQAMEVAFWSRTVDANAPTALLRRFLPPEEGGTDRWAQRNRFAAELIPWGYLPRPLQRLRSDVDPGKSLYSYFAELFIYFPLPQPRVQAMDSASLGQASAAEPTAASNDEVAQRFLRFFGQPQERNSEWTERVLPFWLAAETPRDAMLRGNFEQAISKLVEARDQVKQQKALADVAGAVQAKLVGWCQRVKDAQAAFFVAQEHYYKQNRSPQAKQALDQAKKNLTAVWMETDEQNPVEAEAGERELSRGKPPAHWPLWLPALLGAAAEPMGAEAIYLLALCKHDLASRMQMRLDYSGTKALPAEIQAAHQAWMTTLEKWETYLSEYPSAPGASAARALAAVALEHLGKPIAAAALLKDPSGRLTGLEKVGRLYRAWQLDRKPPPAEGATIPRRGQP